MPCGRTAEPVLAQADLFPVWKVLAADAMYAPVVSRFHTYDI